ncbi:MAG TPA: VOC family protein [Candidatus Limnocylindria bacterium]|nr:VOC family protein [Candidatus Limnocylindria bacterium]
MQKITTFLTYKKGAEDAAKLYTSLFKNSRITDTSRYPGGAPGQAAGDVMTVAFTVDGQEFIALNGGESFSFADGISLSVRAEDQAEIDRLTDALIAGGGTEGPCGWVTDRFGVAWQINPPILGQLLTDPDRAKADRAMQAMLKMKRIDIAELKRAFAGEPAKV